MTHVAIDPNSVTHAEWTTILARAYALAEGEFTDPEVDALRDLSLAHMRGYGYAADDDVTVDSFDWTPDELARLHCWRAWALHNNQQATEWRTNDRVPSGRR